MSLARNSTSIRITRRLAKEDHAPCRRYACPMKPLPPSWARCRHGGAAGAPGAARALQRARPLARQRAHAIRAAWRNPISGSKEPA